MALELSVGAFGELFKDVFKGPIEELIPEENFQINPEHKYGDFNKPHFNILFYRNIDPLSLSLWENKRMTGFNISWH